MWHMEWYYVWWPWLTYKCIVWVCQQPLSFLFTVIRLLSSLIFNSVLCGMRTESANEASVTEILENAATEEYLLPLLIVIIVNIVTMTALIIVLILCRYLSVCTLMSDVWVLTTELLHFDISLNLCNKKNHLCLSVCNPKPNPMGEWMQAPVAGHSCTLECEARMVGTLFSRGVTTAERVMWWCYINMHSKAGS